MWPHRGSEGSLITGHCWLNDPFAVATTTGDIRSQTVGDTEKVYAGYSPDPDMYPEVMHRQIVTSREWF